MLMAMYLLCIELQSFWSLHLIVNSVCVSLNFAGGDADVSHEVHMMCRGAHIKNKLGTFIQRCFAIKSQHKISKFA